MGLMFVLVKVPKSARELVLPLNLSFGPCYIGLKAPMGKEQYLIQVHGERCCRSPRMRGMVICIMSNTSLRPSMPSA